jgi:hypothetical protein
MTSVRATCTSVRQALDTPKIHRLTLVAPSSGSTLSIYTLIFPGNLEQSQTQNPSLGMYLKHLQIIHACSSCYLQLKVCMLDCDC